jgi:hypothetical protein
VMSSIKDSLAETHPELAAQADGWDPTTLSAGSGKKVAWICKGSHSWQSSVTNRTKGSGCPFCSGLRPTIGENDLATTHPELAAQADGWDPTTLSAGSGKKVGWMCDLGHKWKAPVINRRNKTSCPVCLSLATTHPQLAAQADGWDPTTLTAGSEKEVGWKCNLGHQWKARVVNFTKNDTCPVCSSLSITHPELAAQADGWDPTTLTAGSNKSVTWKCNLGHQWSSIVSNRSKGNGCPVCSGKAVDAGFNDLATTHPELAAQADGWDPTTLTAGSGKKVGWKCDLEHKWNTPVSGRSRGQGCPVCSGRSVDTGFNDLATTHPELAAQADGWDPTTLKAGSNKKVKWKCDLAHQWLSTPNDRKGGDGCPVCSNHQTSTGFNDLATTHPQLAAQADGWDPTTLTAGSAKKVGWKCNLGHKWKAVIPSRTRENASNCPVCSGRAVEAGFNDLATTHPELAAQADGWDTTTLSAGSAKKVGWKCELGHQWVTPVSGRSRGEGCPFCSGQRVLIGYSDLATTHPELAAQADGWDPTTLSAGSGKKVGWMCDLGHKWKTQLVNRTNGSNCPTCMTFGFDPNQPSYLYFIEHFNLDMFQIGITNLPEDRLGRHSRRGWEVIEIRGPMEGHLTRNLETSCLHALEKRGAILGHKAGITKFDGYTEAWTKASLKVASIRQILDWVYEDEGVDNES